MNLFDVPNYISCGVSALTKTERALGKPVVLTIEPTNVCNLKCPVCETGAGILKRPKGFMSLSQLKAILDNVGRQVNTLLFYYMGEPFLNKDAYDMITEARKRGIYVSVCTNGEFVDAQKLVDSGVNEVSFQIGGLNQETHTKYRVGGDLDRTLTNLYRVMENWIKSARKRINLKVGFIVMKHNEHEVDSIPWHISAKTEVVNPCVRTVEQGKEFLPDNPKYWFYDKEAFDRGVLKPKVVPHNRCWWIYYSTVVCWNGDVVPCCRDAQGDYVMGNLLTQDFGEIWNGDKYKAFRRQIATKQTDVSLCRLCSGYGIPRLRWD